MLSLAASSYPLLNVFWWMLWFFMFVVWIWLLISIFADIFRSDISGFGKAAWIFFVIILPFLGVLIYLIANGNEMAKRDAEQTQAARAEFDDYVKSTAGSGGPAAEND
ncbi:MAG TPA: PLDc N-terminal domain-containing protein, partial [Acidimicrobiia bacterium]|nr:PLDc N-terminal domain-containing protein [Acidimicrobiia bacterium]